ncbi:glycerol kinase GlpK [Adlercreutzia muris]|uniref:Glycerol kinase n=1 Tax=Adlercreutzia muris TaxID=1796610 RepID=A0A7C8BS16_9ACTN|nr:glycerol kinase GlpK [Adlercreutzia muris]KAB1651113.1 glycerol kinase GlpK [Adlercreutzia muris]MCR2028457.1 glycerol kinase GlpK [Adlercreutzia muris]MCU7584647.1 glycerol kinase GlpK [Adlercreutzia muris]
MKKYVIALDQGTTSSRAMLIDRGGRAVGSVQRPFPQLYPQPGWVEHDPHDILSSQLGALTELLLTYSVSPAEIDSIGITNQRETTVVWDRATGEPIANAIVWQCRRTAPMVEALTGDPAVAAEITARTGLVPDAYFSASKIAWILGEVPGARARAEAGELAFGTVDSWLIWKLTYGAVHATDVTNASRTMLYNIHEGCWDPYLLELFGIPASLMPEVRPSAGDFGVTANPGLVQGVPIRGVAGDQQAALFGQCCFSAGQAKNTYGTGCFLLMHTGHEACASRSGLLTTVAASAPGTKGTEYALEGSVFMAGALIQWLRDELGIIDSVADADAIARSVPSTEGVVVVPAFTGLGAPWWDADARGAILGLTRGAGRAHIVRAALEALAYQVCDLAQAMIEDAGVPLSVLNVDGGAAANDFLMQFQAAMLGVPLRRPANAETTALGAAFLAGLATGFWPDTAALAALREGEERFLPTFDEAARASRLARWRDAVARVRS